MGQKTRNKLIKFIPLDTPQHILMNYSSLLLLAVCIGMALGALFVAHYLGGMLPFLCLFTGTGLATLWTIYRPPQPFLVKELLEKRHMELRELEESALRVLAFLKSKDARRIVLSISFVSVLVVLLVWYLSSLVLPKPIHTPEQEGFETKVGGSIAFGFFFAGATFGNHAVILCRYILRHWNHIQRKYEPWPVDKPYNRSLKFWKDNVRCHV